MKLYETVWPLHYTLEKVLLQSEMMIATILDHQNHNTQSTVSIKKITMKQHRNRD